MCLSRTHCQGMRPLQLTPCRALPVPLPPQDMYQTLEYLLSNAPKALFAAFPKDWGNFGKASGAAYKMKRRHAALRELYSKT